jgi:serpin B
MTDIEPDEGREDLAARPLRVLTRRTPVTSGWRAPDTVRRTAIRRRRTRWSAGAAVALAGAVAAALSLGGSAANHHVATHPPRVLPGGQQRTGAHIGSAIQLVARAAPITTASPSAVAAVVAAEQRLTLALLSQVGHGSNVTVSPASLYLALGMLQNAARGATADEISTAVHADGLSVDRQNEGLAALTNDLDAAAAKDGIQLDSANSMWQQDGFVVKPQFLRALSAYYHAGVWQVDFGGHISDAIKALNAWTSEKTHGKITKLFARLDPTTVLVLANAIYFHAAWATPFDKAETSNAEFTRADGTQVTAKFMSGGPGLHAAATSNYQAAELPYHGGRFAALAIMPTSGSLDAFVATLTPAKIDSIASSLTPGVRVSMPRFRTASKLDLKPVLQALGMRRAFRPDADLSGLSHSSTMVDQVIQRDYLSVGEHGTTAAAVTGISIVPTSGVVGPAVNLDHPFLFLVRDTKTGAILFASEITDPGAG